MNERPIVFLDSGLGCLPYANFFHSRNPGEKIICLADRGNFPYGSKSKEELAGLLIELTHKLISLYDPKMLILACNTASVSALSELREQFPDLSIVGTVPAIKPAAEVSKTRYLGLLGTKRTLEDPYNLELLEQFGPDCTIVGKTAASLVDFVEYSWAEVIDEEKTLIAKQWVDKFRAENVDAIVLACTHFLLLKDEFIEAAGDDVQVFDSMEGICRRVESLLDSGEMRSGISEAGEMELKITGKAELEPYWEKLKGRFNLSLERI